MTVRNRIFWVAVAGSLALHAVLLLWPMPPPAPPRPGAPGTLVMVEVAAPPPRPTTPATAEAVRPRPQARPLAPVAALPPATADAPRVAPATDARDSDAPRAALQLTPALLATGTFALAFDAGVVAPELPRGLQAVLPPKDLVSGLVKETLGRGRVDRGLVHPYYSTLGKALIKHWDAERVAKGGGLKNYGEQLGQNLKIFNDIWLDRAATYGKSGSPLDPTVGTPDSNRRAPGNDRVGGLAGEDLEARKELARQMGAQFKATRRATIRVVQDRLGKLVKVELVEPSSDARVDQEALKDVQAAAEQLPPPPEEAVAGREALSSLWSFELIVSISPPVPSFTFEFDEALGFIDARLPLDRRIYKKVRLVSVE